MKEDFNIEQLLNGFIDNELTEKERTEVERLIAHDPAVANRIEELKKYKILIGSLPASKAPAEMLDNIKGAIAAKEYSVLKQSYGRRIAATTQLLFRKAVSVAAMFILILALTAVIYMIVSPPSAIEPKPDLTIGQLPSAANQLIANLELKITSLSDGEEAVRKALENAGILQITESAVQTNKCQYSFNCTGEQLNLILASLEEKWEEFKSPKLVVDTAVADKPAVINDVTTWQIAEIASQDSFERRTKAAQYFAILNNNETLPGQAEDLNNIDIESIPKPVLTKDEFEAGKTAEGKLSINFNIILETAE